MSPPKLHQQRPINLGSQQKQKDSLGRKIGGIRRLSYQVQAKMQKCIGKLKVKHRESVDAPMTNM